MNNKGAAFQKEAEVYDSLEGSKKFMIKRNRIAAFHWRKLVRKESQRLPAAISKLWHNSACMGIRSICGQRESGGGVGVMEGNGRGKQAFGLVKRILYSRRPNEFA